MTDLELNAIAGAIAETINNDTHMDQDVEFKLRKMYTNLIRHLDRDVLTSLSEKIKKVLDLEDVMDEPKLYEIGLYGRLHELNKNIITFGRDARCDIVIDHHSCSRLQGIAFITTTNVIVVDPGSFLGIHTVKRSSDKDLVHSLPGQRRGLIFDRDESFELNMVESVTCTPKICIICVSRPRMVKSNCGHYLMCTVCYDKVRREFIVCPLCKRRMDSGTICNEFMSCVIGDQ